MKAMSLVKLKRPIQKRRVIIALVGANLAKHDDIIIIILLIFYESGISCNWENENDYTEKVLLLNRLVRLQCFM